MPIKTIFKPRHVSEEEFREIDFQTMGFAFAIQNEMGRFWSEEIYQNELAYRCQKAGFDRVEKEVPIKVSFKDFEKTYLLSEWGAYLDIHLYNETIYHFRGGEENVVQKISVANGERIIGEQKMHLLNNHVAFKISAILKDQDKYEQELHKFLRFTPLRAIQWINFNHDHITFKTISI